MPREKISNAIRVIHVWAAVTIVIVVLYAWIAGDGGWGYYGPFLGLIAFVYLAVIIGTLIANRKDRHL